MKVHEKERRNLEKGWMPGSAFLPPERLSGKEYFSVQIKPNDYCYYDLSTNSTFMFIPFRLCVLSRYVEFRE